MTIRSKVNLGIVLLIFLVALGQFFSVHIAQKSLQERIGNDLFVLAQETIDDIDRSVFHRAESFQAETQDLTLQKAVKESNRQFEALEDIQATIDQQEAAWRAAPKEMITPFMATLINNELAQNLKAKADYYETQYEESPFSEVFVTNQYGANVAQTGKTTDYYQADEAWWQQAKEEGLFIGDVEYDESAQAYGMDLGIRIEGEQGQFLGVLKAVLNIQDVFHILEEIVATAQKAEQREIEFKLLTKDYRIIYATEEYGILESLPENLIQDIVLSSAENEKFFIDVGDKPEEGEEEELFAFARSTGHRDYKGVGWILSVEEETAEILLPVANLQRFLFLIAGLIVIAALFSGLFFSRKVVRPLLELKTVAEKLAKGARKVKVKVKSKDEIGELGNTFNQMAAELLIAEKQNAKYAKGLEAEVKKRTKELEKEKKRAEEEAKKAGRLKAATLNILEDVKEVESKLSLQNVLLESQYNSSPDGMVVVGAKGGITSYNKSFVKIWEMPARLLKTLDDQKMIEYAVGLAEDPESFQAKIRHYYAHQNKMGEFKVELKNGKVINIISVPMKGKRGQYYGRFWYFRDITKEAEIDRAKTEFVSLASHQLRTPLTSIKWILQKSVGRKEELTKWQKEFLNDALDSTQRMIELVNDLLNVSRIEANVLNVESKKTDLVNFIEAIVKEAKVVAKEKHQTIEFKKPKAKIAAHLDPQLITQVIGNLLSNAMNYSDPNTLIEISAKKVGGKIKIAVKDQGIGMSKEDQRKLFVKFFRSAEASKRSTTGSGLGLYVIKKVLDVCKGEVKVDSEPGKGTIFTVTLPVRGPAQRGQKSLVERRLRS